MSNLRLTLIRREAFPQGILGELQVFKDSKPPKFFHTLELPDRGNARYVSCIPEGDYEIHTRRGGGYFETYKERWDHKFSIGVNTPGMDEVEGRSAILIHTGNKPIHTRGCILVGETSGVVAGSPRVWRSRDAYARLYDVVSGTDGLFGMNTHAPLEIVEAPTMNAVDRDEDENVDREDL